MVTSFLPCGAHLSQSTALDLPGDSAVGRKCSPPPISCTQIPVFFIGILYNPRQGGMILPPVLSEAGSTRPAHGGLERRHHGETVLACTRIAIRDGQEIGEYASTRTQF